MDTFSLVILIAVVVLLAFILLRSRRNISDTPPGSGQVVLPTRPVPATLDADLRTILASGNKIEAIKQVRAATGLGLKEAKDYVDALERNQPLPLPTPAPVPPLALGEDLDTQVRTILASGNKIEAIKQVRAATGLGLKEAKDYVDALEKRLASKLIREERAENT